MAPEGGGSLGTTEVLGTTRISIETSLGFLLDFSWISLGFLLDFLCFHEFLGFPRI